MLSFFFVFTFSTGYVHVSGGTPLYSFLLHVTLPFDYFLGDIAYSLSDFAF